MKKMNAKRQSVARIASRALVLATFLAMVLSAAGTSHAQSQSTALKSAQGGTTASAQAAGVNTASGARAGTPKPTAEPTRPAAQSASGARQEGIMVHGFWTIDVRNPDGKLVAHREFENSLTYTGAQLLQSFVSGYEVPGARGISLGATLPGDKGPCAGATFSVRANIDITEAVNGSCILAQPNGNYPNFVFGESGCQGIAGCSPTLTLSLPPNLLSQIMLSGQATAVSNGTIDIVTTLVMVCSTQSAPLSSVDPNSCATAFTLPANSFLSPSADVSPVGYPFTSQVLNGSSATSTPPAAVPVGAGQTIQASVVLSFN